MQGRRDISYVIEGVRGLCSMSCIDPKAYAVEDGWAHIVARDRDIQKHMKITQLRKFFDSVKRIKTQLRTERDKDRKIDDIKEIKAAKYELFPELAYAWARELITDKFYELMKICLSESKTINVRDFEAFEKFLSAILAYYKMEKKKGGK